MKNPECWFSLKGRSGDGTESTCSLEDKQAEQGELQEGMTGFAVYPCLPQDM